MRKYAVIAALISLILAGAPTYAVEITEAHEARARELVAQMTLDEKLSYITGETRFTLRPVERLGIPRVLFSDGPQGIRNHCSSSVLYPCGTMLAATWNRDTGRRYGASLADDARARGISVLLGPGVNICRYPLCGRNFEYMGEDPFLASEIAAEYIGGVQSRGVIATIKHFAANNQEWSRHHTSSDVDLRTLHEIYFPAFRKAVENGVGAVMNSYNLINGVHATENRWLNTDILRLRWGFRGILMSDWTSVYSTVNAANSGLDLEMPAPVFFTDSLLADAMAKGRITERTIDDKVTHILQTLIAFGVLDRPEDQPAEDADFTASRATALEAAREGIVLLRNDDDILPLKGSVAVLGPMADTIVSGGGSGAVNPVCFVSPLAGLRELRGKAVRYVADTVLTEPDAIKTVRKADNVVVFVGFTAAEERESADRTFGLPESQVQLILKTAEHNPNTIVVINAGGAVDLTSFIDKVKGIVMAWYPGQEGGMALAEVLTGRISPSGKLPITWDRTLAENPCHDSYRDNRTKVRKNKKGECKHVEYNEGIFTGYRGYDRNKIRPLFPFGFGLSYASFEYSDPSVSKDGDDFIISFSVCNTGSMAAAEVAQIYVGPVAGKSEIDGMVCPAKELKEFVKIKLAPGESRRVSVTLTPETFSRFDIDEDDWRVLHGTWTVGIGGSSDALPLQLSIEL